MIKILFLIPDWYYQKVAAYSSIIGSIFFNEQRNYS